MKEKYIKILKWAYDKNIFTEEELFEKFNLNNEVDKKWYLNVFRGGQTNDDCIIKLCDFRNGKHYLCLSAKDFSHYQNLKPAKSSKLVKSYTKIWYEKPLGIIVITIIAGVIIGGILFWLGWI